MLVSGFSSLFEREFCSCWAQLTSWWTRTRRVFHNVFIAIHVREADNLLFRLRLRLTHVGSEYTHKEMGFFGRKGKTKKTERSHLHSAAWSTTSPWTSPVASLPTGAVNWETWDTEAVYNVMWTLQCNVTGRPWLQIVLTWQEACIVLPRVPRSIEHTTFVWRPQSQTIWHVRSLPVPESL